MEQYILKSTLLAEINRQIELLKPFLGACAGQIVAEAYAKLSILEGLKNFLDTLEVIEIGVDLGDPKGDKSAIHIIDTKTHEVKEVDLEKEVDDWYNTKASKEFENVLYSDIENCAKHFFELGLKTQKGK